MSTHTEIEWTDRTWNPITGCSEVSSGCANCYAAKFTATRLSKRPEYKGLAVMQEGKPRFTGEVRFHEDRLQEPLHWKKPSRVFVNSMSDLFHEKVSDWELDQIFAQMVNCDRHVFQILTKRPRRMKAWLDELERQHVTPIENVWLGVSTEIQHFADERIPVLLETPAAVRFISAEPLLGAIDLTRMGRDGELWAGLNSLTGEQPCCHEHPDLIVWHKSLDWVICGGESGANARPMHPEWARSLRDQCVSAGVPFFFKQWGSWLPIERHGFRPKKRAGTIYALRMHRTTECGEVDELVYHAYPSDANDDDGPYWEMTWTGHVRKKHRQLDGREWNEFPK